MAINQGYSGLFQSLSSSNGSSNFLADYASLKSGSYGRLMKAYYGTTVNSSSTSSGTGTRTSNVLDKILEERKNPKVSEEVQEANANLTTGISNLKKTVASLQNDSTYTATQNAQTGQVSQSAVDKTVSAMKDYVAQYNDVVNASKKSTMTNKTGYIANIMSSTAANADKLKEIGVTINTDGTLMLNEKKLRETDVTKVQDLFSSKDLMSYGSTVASRLNFAGISSSTTEDADKDNKAGTGASGVKADSEALASDKLYEKVKDKDGNMNYDIDKILSTANSFVSNYNQMFIAGQSSTNSGVISNLAQIREKTQQNKDALKQFGFDVDEKGRLKLDEDKFKKSDMSQVQKFFKDYGSSIATNASLVDYYSTTKANAASGYTSSGKYSVQGNSLFADSI